MTTRTFEVIPREKFNTFHELLKAHGGRYTSNPMIFQEVVHVHYEFESGHREFSLDWIRYTTNITEKRKQLGFFSRLYRNIKDRKWKNITSL